MSTCSQRFVHVQYIDEALEWKIFYPSFPACMSSIGRYCGFASAIFCKKESF